MTFLEKELEDFVFEMIKTPSELIERGLEIYSGYEYFRQLNIDKYGVADIVGIRKEICHESKKARFYFHVIELKKQFINYATLGQACRYLSGLKCATYGSVGEDYDVDIIQEIALIGTEIDLSTDFIFL